jgi:hypothetical protein
MKLAFVSAFPLLAVAVSMDRQDNKNNNNRRGKNEAHAIAEMKRSLGGICHV